MAVAVRTPKQQWQDYLYRQVKSVNQWGDNKRMRWRKCSHNFCGSITRIFEHLTGRAGDVKACTYSQTNDKREVLDEPYILEYDLPKSKKRKAAELNEREHASSSGLKQMAIEQAMEAAGSLGVDKPVLIGCTRLVCPSTCSGELFWLLLMWDIRLLPCLTQCLHVTCA